MTRTVQSPTDHVVVVGAGLAGLATALHLLGAGRRVTVVERDPTPGGRAGRLDLNGFRLDTGPTVITMPELIEEALAAVGEKLGDRLELVDLHPAYHARFADGSAIDVHTDPGAMEQEIREKVSAARRRGLPPAAGLAHRALPRADGDLHRRQLRLAARRPGPRPGAAGRARGLRAARRRGSPSSCDDERLRRIFSFQALYAGVPPAKALAAYAVIAYMDTIAGVSFPKGGVRALPQALADAAADAGAEFRYGTTVTGLERSGGRVRALRTVPTDEPSADGDRLAADAVVLTCDLPVSYGLLGRTPRRVVPMRWSPSAFVWHAGVAGRHRLGAPHHLLRRRLGGHVRRDHHRGTADVRPVAAGHPPDGHRPVAGARRARARVRARSRARTPTRPRSTGSASARATATSCVGVLAARGLELGEPVERSTWSPPTTGAGRPRGGHPVLGGAHVRADRPVPCGQPRARRGQRRPRRLGDDARRRRPDGARVGQARGGADHGVSGMSTR